MAFIKRYLLIFLILSIGHILVTTVLIEPSWLKALFDVSREKNLPTLFQTVLFLHIAAACWQLRKEGIWSNLKRYWNGLQWLFIFLALDEWFSLHDTLGGSIGRLINPDTSHPWLITYAILVPVFAIIMLYFLAKLPNWARWQWIVAGGIFVFGAMGMEYANSLAWPQVWMREAVLFLEEGMEMIGLLLALYVFGKALSVHGSRLQRLPKPALWFLGFCVVDMTVSQVVWLQARDPIIHPFTPNLETRK